MEKRNLVAARRIGIAATGLPAWDLHGAAHQVWIEQPADGAKDAPARRRTS